jgi:hypothetical protein
LRFIALALVLAGCGGGGSDDDASEPAFPADYAATYTEVRNCRQSGDHDLNRIRVLADPQALGPYTRRDAPIPVDAVLLKEEYDIGDVDCTGPIKQWTVMQRLETGTAPETLDWRWQRVDAERAVVGEDTPACYGCHAGCTEAAGGHDWTCTLP